MSKPNQIPAWFKYPNYHWQNKRAVVIGAGIAGCQISWHLAELGWNITLIERNEEIATEASGNPAGVISPKMTSIPSAGEDFYTASFEYTLNQLNLLKTRGIKWHDCGLLQLTHNNREEQRWQALTKRDFSDTFLQLIDETKTSEIANIQLPFKGSYFPKAGWINPGHFCDVLSRHKNINKLLKTNALCIQKQQNLWQVLDTENGEAIAREEVVIIANGKDITQFEQTKDLPSMPVAGQTTLGAASDNSRKLKTVIGHEGYLTPVDTESDKHTFGATFDRNNSSPTITEQADRENLSQLNQYLPEFSDSLTKTESAHAAVRLTTPDRFPYAGAISDWDFYATHYDDLHHGKKWKEYPQAEYQQGLFVLGGFGSRGLTTSGYCAKLLTSMIENKTLTDTEQSVLQNCHPARYFIKQLKRA